MMELLALIAIIAVLLGITTAVIIKLLVFIFAKEKNNDLDYYSDFYSEYEE